MTATLTRTALPAVTVPACRCLDPGVFGHACAGFTQRALGDHRCPCGLRYAGMWGPDGVPLCRTCGFDVKENADG